jgi:hypothetical protein
MSNIEIFAREHNLTRQQVHLLVYIANKYTRASVSYHNGDRYPESGTDDKEKNSVLWGKKADEYYVELQKKAKLLGFDGIVANGLYPELVKNGKIIGLPHEI